MEGRLTPLLMMLVLKGLRLIRDDGSWSSAEEVSSASIFNWESLAAALTMGTTGLRRAIEAGVVTNALDARKIAMKNTTATARIDGGGGATGRTKQPRQNPKTRESGQGDGFCLLEMCILIVGFFGEIKLEL